MLACLLDGTNKIALRQVPVPKLDRGDVLVKMEACGICGTDLEKVEGKLGPGGILGHEVSGTVLETSADVQDYKIGDRVVVHHHVPCYKCTLCMRGDFTLCAQFKKTNIEPCGLAESFRVPRYNVERGAIMELPEEISFEEGSMIEPTACCIRAIHNAGVKQNDNVLVVGLGPTGLTHTQLLRHLTRGRIIGTDLIESRRRMGHKLGADTTLDPQVENVPSEVEKLIGQGADMALVATGNEKALGQAFASVRKGGKIVLFGAPASGAHYQLDVSTFFSKQIAFVSSYSCVESEMHEAIQLLSTKQLDLRGLISNRFMIREADKAIEHSMSSKEAIKTMVTP
jgi:L-iditol 2-dehydrogenase